MNLVQHLFYAVSSLRFTVLLICLGTSAVYAQNPQRPANVLPPPVASREISGIVKDTLDNGIPGSTIRLASERDTLVAITNGDGIFVFKNVKSATYTLTVTNLGFIPLIAKFKQNDAIPRIVMDPLVLKEAPANSLETVIISGAPSITYKTDTVEYKASDYIVRPNATVDEMLKKMEGMEVSNEGGLIHNGTTVTRAKLNGKEYLGGDLANAIKNLPAEIVDKIQIVDDYGDQAARTGIKDGDPEKILNITTRNDKSVGNILRLNGAIGNNNRYEATAFGSRINRNQQIGLNGNFRNTVNGVAGGEGGGRAQGGGGSGGTTTFGNGTFSIRDKVGTKFEYNINYGFSATDVVALNNSFSESVTNIRTNAGIDSLARTFSTRGNRSNNDSRNHNFRGEFEFNLDSNNFIRFAPTITYNSTLNKRSDSLFQTGFIHQNQISLNTNSSTRPRIGGTIFYSHLFAKKRRNLSVTAELNRNDTENEQEQRIDIRYFLNEAETIVRDSLVNRIIARKNLQSTYRGSITFVEPLTTNTQLELNAQVNSNNYDNTATTRNVIASGVSQVIDSLSNIYDYSFTQARVALNYRYGMSNMSKVRFSAGLTAVPAILSGTKVSLGTTTNRRSLNLIPIARFEYLWSRQHKVSFNYSGNAVEPTFDQIQPVRDVTNPQNPVIGNPNLKATFVHTIRTEYNNYLANSKLNYSVNGNISFTDNAVIRNSTNIIDPNIEVAPGQRPVRIIETSFQNRDGVYRLNGNYSISKQLSDRRYNLSLSGSASYDHRLTMNNGELNINTVKTFIERFGPRINPVEWFEVNPYVSYNTTISSNSLLKNNIQTNTLALNIDGRVYAWDSWILGYSASKNFVSGINANITNNPFIINANLEKELFNRRGKITLQAFDLLNQNNFINREINDDGGYTDTRSNALSRYFMVRFTMRLQKWTGARGRNNNQPLRRGDGSFVN
ncbi:MAG: TonB-dependent receptor [Pedobacter sp.]|nr:MAG: TonB-dependent receptor [Pedobacter sp.]